MQMWRANNAIRENMSFCHLDVNGRSSCYNPECKYDPEYFLSRCESLGTQGPVPGYVQRLTFPWLGENYRRPRFTVVLFNTGLNVPLNIHTACNAISRPQGDISDDKCPINGRVADIVGGTLAKFYGKPT